MCAAWGEVGEQRALASAPHRFRLTLLLSGDSLGHPRQILPEAGGKVIPAATCRHNMRLLLEGGANQPHTAHDLPLVRELRDAE